MEAELDKRLKGIEQMTLLAAKRILSVSDVALLTGRSEKTIRNRLNEIPHFHGPLGVAVRREDLEQWMITTPTI